MDVRAGGSPVVARSVPATASSMGRPALVVATARQRESPSRVDDDCRGGR